MKHLNRLAAAAAVAAIAMLGPAQADTLADVQARGVLKCGTSDKLPGFSFIDDKGQRTGFEIDNCRAIAAAVLGDASKMEAVPLVPRDAFTTLASGGVDVFVDRATWTFLRSTQLGFNYGGVYFYDGEGFMVKKSAGITSVNQLDQATICVTQGTTSELNIADYFGTHKMHYQLVTYADPDESRRAYESGRCDAWSIDRTVLASRGLAMAHREDHVILPEIISREPLGPMVRKGDDRWHDIVFWVLNLRVAAEALGLTSANVEEQRKASTNPEVQRILGVTGDFGKALGLGNDWGYQAVKQVGNYGETFERHLGRSTPLGLDRGATALWRDGGLMYPLPFR
jgi:general L-amino acid transport system substrate-binding protein